MTGRDERCLGGRRGRGSQGMAQAAVPQLRAAGCTGQQLPAVCRYHSACCSQPCMAMHHRPARQQCCVPSAGVTTPHPHHPHQPTNHTARTSQPTLPTSITPPTPPGGPGRGGSGSGAPGVRLPGHGLSDPGTAAAPRSAWVGGGQEGRWVREAATQSHARCPHQPSGLSAQRSCQRLKGTSQQAQQVQHSATKRTQRTARRQ